MSLATDTIYRNTFKSKKVNTPLNKLFTLLSSSYFVQSAGAVEYTDCTTAEG